MKQKRYMWAGVLVVLESRDKERYVVLNKRTSDAPTNPDVYSGFFGHIDGEKESLYPEVAAQRELFEEVFISSKNKEEVYNLVFSKNIDIKKSILKKSCLYTQRLIDLWKKEKGVDINKDNIFSLRSHSATKEVDFIDFEMARRAKVFVVNFKLPLDIDDIYIFCGETRQENPPEELLDRRIDLFNIRDLKDWWLDKSRKAIKTRASFSGGEKIEEKLISDVSCFSSNIALVFDKWWKG